MLTLKPCPFCGRQPEVFPQDPGNEGGAWTMIKCTNSRCKVRVSVEHYADRRHRQQATRKWNKRKEPDRG